MRKLLIIPLIALLIGCAPVASTVNIPPLTPGNWSQITYTDIHPIPTIAEGFGLYGLTATFKNVYPGWSGTIPLTIVNGQDKDRMFIISLKQPSNLKVGYTPLPKEYYCWITISETVVNVSAGKIYQVPVTLSMPSDADYAGKRVEVNILVEDTTQTGLVQIALEDKWYIITSG